MGMLYSQLTEGERNQIYALLQEDVSQCRIAMILGRDSSTIGREIRRNRGQRGYRPKQAQRKAQERRKIPRSRKMTRKWLPTLRKNFARTKKQGGDLYRKLRIAGVKKRRKRYGKKDWRGKIPNRVDIDQRPAIVEEKMRIGDWEADLVSGVHHRGFLVTLVERTTR